MWITFFWFPHIATVNVIIVVILHVIYTTAPAGKHFSSDVGIAAEAYFITTWFQYFQFF
jgi:hypothetical protein